MLPTSLRVDAPDLAAEIGHVELTDRVLSERRNLPRLARRGDVAGDLGQAAGLAAGVLEAPELARAIVRVQIGAAERWDLLAAVHEAAGHRAAVAVIVLGHGQLLPALIAARGRVEAVRAFHHAPAVVGAAALGGRLHVDLFPLVLPDVTDVHVARARVEGPAPRVSEAKAPDLRRGAATGHVAARDTVGLAARRRVDVDAGDLAEQRAERLPVAGAAVFVPSAAAVTQADVQHAVGSEVKVTAVVVALGLVHLDHDLRAGRVGLVRIRGAALVLSDHRVAAAGLGVVHEEATVVGVGRVKRDAEQALFVAAALGLVVDVQERGGDLGAGLDQADEAVLLAHEEPVGVARGAADPDRTVVAGGHLGELQVHGAARRRAVEERRAPAGAAAAAATAAAATATRHVAGAARAAPPLPPVVPPPPPLPPVLEPPLSSSPPQAPATSARDTAPAAQRKCLPIGTDNSGPRGPQAE